MTEKVVKHRWEMNYDEIYKDWESRYAFGAKGELTPNEAKEIHIKWKTLGIKAAKGIL